MISRLRLFALALVLPVAAIQAETTAAKADTDSVVRVNSTNQAFNFVRPWIKRQPFTRRGIGVILPGNRVLVTAELVANHNYVELERATSSEKSPAEVVQIDYESNLALLEPQIPGFLDDAKPVQLADDIRVGSRVEILQLESSDAIALTPGVVTTITVLPYPMDGVALLTYKLSVPLQYRDNSFTMPVFSGDKLAGLLMRYDMRSQTADIVPDVVISSFLQRAAKTPYQGFPRAGIAFAPTRDPQFRRYLGMAPGQSGVYIVSVQHGSAAEKAGLRKGDVLMRIDGYDINEDGNIEHPHFGRIPFSHLISTEHLPGEKLLMHVFRGGTDFDLELSLEPRDPSTVISEPLIMDKAPRYLILGGVVFQELSRSYLREWGADWKNSAPPRLVYLDEFQDELPADRGKIVFISQILPADTTIGYEDVGTVVVEKVNNREIRSLEDVAEAVKNPVNGFHKIELESDPGTIYLDPKAVEEGAEALKASYGLPALQNLAR